MLARQFGHRHCAIGLLEDADYLFSREIDAVGFFMLLPYSGCLDSAWLVFQFGG